MTKMEATSAVAHIHIGLNRIINSSRMPFILLTLFWLTVTASAQDSCPPFFTDTSSPLSFPFYRSTKDFHLGYAPYLSTAKDNASSVIKQRSGEIRAMWVVRDSMTSPQQIRNAVALARKYHFNTLFVQVRGRGDAFYDSHYEPRSESLAHYSPRSFDPLAVAVTEGHRAGLQVHAWLNTFLVWHQRRRPYSSQHIVIRHPEWLVQDKNQNITMTEQNDCEGAFLDAAYEGVREHLKNVFQDVAAHYAVDGIHLDYVRFPCERFSFSSHDMTAFREYALPLVASVQAAYADSRLRAGNRLAWYYCFPAQWGQWRRDLITETVRGISDAVHAQRPGIIVSAAVFPNYRVAESDKGQAWHEWLRMGLLDAAVPMSYNQSTRLVAAQIRDAVIHSAGRPIVAGVGAWRIPPASAIDKVRAYRSVGAAGCNFFSYGEITRFGRSEAYLSRISSTLFKGTVRVPDWRRHLETAWVSLP